jgi:sarcosine oxidase, subunit beta
LKARAKIGIIGAGIIGASIAYNLVQMGETDVVILDSGRAGGGSTSAALGGFRHQFSNELSIRMSKESIEFLSGFRELTGYDPLITKDGYCFVAETESSMGQLEKNRKLQTSLGIEVESLSADQLSKSYPYYNFQGIMGGNLCMKDGHASTLAVFQGFVSSAKNAGVEFYENSPVTGIEMRDRTARGIVTSNGEISCDKVVIAAGAYSGLVGRFAGTNIPISPVPRRTLITSSVPGGFPNEFPLIIDIDSTLAVGREGNGMVMGDNVGNPEGFELKFPEDYDERLLEKAVQRIPSLGDATIAYENQGLYEVAPDSNPIISSIPDFDNLYCCAGFSGHGFMHSPAAGKLMAEILLGKTPHLDIAPLDIRRFSKHPNEKEKMII